MDTPQERQVFPSLGANRLVIPIWLCSISGEPEMPGVHCVCLLALSQHLPRYAWFLWSTLGLAQPPPCPLPLSRNRASGAQRSACLCSPSAPLHLAQAFFSGIHAGLEFTVLPSQSQWYFFSCFSSPSQMLIVIF